MRHLQGVICESITEVLYRSPRTIEVHCQHIMEKLGVTNLVELVKRCIYFDELTRAEVRRLE